MKQTATTRPACTQASGPHTHAAGTAERPCPTGAGQHGAPGRRGSRLLAPLRWLRRKLTGLVRWVAKRLWAPLRPLARLLMLGGLSKHLPAPLRWLVHLFAPDRERGFGFWWLVATIAVAVALGMLVALLLSPVAALIALLVVAIWALVRWRRSKRDDRDDASARAPARGTDQQSGGPEPAPAAAA